MVLWGLAVQLSTFFDLEFGLSNLSLNIYISLNFFFCFLRMQFQCKKSARNSKAKFQNLVKQICFYSWAFLFRKRLKQDKDT